MSDEKTSNQNNNNNVARVSENPFGRSSTMIRTPPSTVAQHVKAGTTIDLTSQSDSSTPGRWTQQVATPQVKAGRSTQPVITPQEKTFSINDLVSHPDFLTLGENLEALVVMLKDGQDGQRRSVHQPMRDAIAKAKEMYVRIDLQLKQNKDLFNDNSSQTSPLLKIGVEPKRKKPNNEGTPRAKRQQTTEKKTASKEKGDDKPAEETGSPKSSSSKENTSKKELAWQTATSKRKRKKKDKKEGRKRPRPDAIIIKATGKVTYADMIRKMQADPKLEQLGDAVSKIRRTQKGELLIQLKSSKHPTSLFKEGIGTSLGENAEVKSLTSITTIECKDIDEITTTEDVVTAIKKQYEIDSISSGDITLRKAYGGTQTASIKTSEANAKKLLDKGELKLGWSICHFREKATLTKCFRCLEFGHIARNCRSDTDRSKMCRKCGEEGHIAKLCTKNACCMFCVKEHPDKAKHVAGSNSCPVFRRALSKKK